MGLRIGLFGGSFNPIHHGHLLIARSLHEKLNLSRTVFLPSRQPPHKAVGELAAPEARAEMVQRAIRGEPDWSFDSYDLTRPGPCYTIETIEYFRKKSPADDLYWFIGADSLMDLSTWHRSTDLVRTCTIITAARSGRVIDPAPLESAFGLESARKLLKNVLSTPVIDISSTDIRARIARGLSVRYMLPESVREYIEANGLYRELVGPPNGNCNPSRVC